MKKLIMTMAIAAMTFGAFTSGAQTRDRVDAQKTQASDKMYRPQKFTDFAFEGILLDMPQQARIDSLNAAIKPNCPQGACCDSVKCDKTKRDKHARHQGARAKNMRSEYVKKVKEILTPEQYTMFLENIVLMPQPEKIMVRDAKHHRADKQKAQVKAAKQAKNKAAKAAKDAK